MSKKIKKSFKNTLLTVLLLLIIGVPLLWHYLGWFPAILIAGAGILAPFVLEIIGKSFSKKRKKKQKSSKSHASSKSKSSKSKPSKKRKKRSKKKIFKVFLLVILIGAILGIVGGLGLFIYISKTAPDFDPENLYSKESSVVYDMNGDEFASLGLNKRENIAYSDLSESFIDALLATEDSRFFTHNGFDLPRFTKSMLENLKSVSFAQGGSTLTMQVAKNRFTTKEKSVIRKLNDIYLAIFKIEEEYTKEEIIEFYVNYPYLGGSSYGVEQASQTYFNKSVSDLNVSEAAMLAGMFQAPNAYDPFLYPEATEERRKTVLYLMNYHGYISDEEYEIALKMTVDKIVVGSNASSGNPYQGYLDTVIEEVIAKTGESPYNVAMEIYTNMDPEKQAAAEGICNGELFEFENDVVQTGFSVIDIDTGKVLAIGAGRNREGERSFNYATMISRQPGSTAKPIFDYGPAIEFNNWSTYHMILDDDYQYSNGVDISNWDNAYKGLMTARSALALSRNIPALKTFQAVNNKNILDFVQSLGITPEVDDGYLHEAHAIGGFNGVSPMEMAAAYAAFGNGGYYIEPHTVSKIVYKNTAETLVLTPTKERVMKESTAFMVTDMMISGVNEGTVSGARLSGVVTAGKTGTTNLDSKTEAAWGLPSYACLDLWLIAYTPNISIGLWYGYKELSSEYYHGRAAGTERNKLFQTVLKEMVTYDGAKFPTTSSVVRVTVEKETSPAALPSPNTPADMKVTEYFVRGTAPSEVSPRYSSLDNVTGLDGTFDNNTNKVVLNWDELPTPYYLEDDYLKDYYTELCGKTHADKYLNLRLAYDEEFMGDIIYEVYLKSADDSLSLLEKTSTPSYTYTIEEAADEVSFVVKTNYSIFTKAASPGVTLTVSLESANFTEISLVGNSNITINAGDDWSDPGVEVMNFDEDVTSDATITKTIKDATDNTILNIDTSIIGTYTIKYVVSYEDSTETLTRTVIIN